MPAGILQQKSLPNPAVQSRQVRNKQKKVYVATYTNEGLSFQIHLGPLKFEPHKRGRQPKVPVATI